jgi:DNA-binding transcriptional MerR regulator
VLCLRATPAPATGDFQLHAYVNDTCIVADEPYFVPDRPAIRVAGQPESIPLFGLVVGGRAELFANNEKQVGPDALHVHGARKDTRYAAATRMSLYRADFDPAPVLRLNSKLGCITIVAAEFAPDSTDCMKDYNPKELARENLGLPQSQWKTSRTDDSIENPLRRANVCVEGKARAVYEARFELSNDGTAYRLKDAGYQITSLLTTQEEGATRTAFYTLKIFAPNATQHKVTLSSAWVNLGTVSAGAHSVGSAADSAWLRVPPLSAQARRLYEARTHLQQQVTREGEALGRAITQNKRLLARLDQRIAAASADKARSLRKERTKIESEVQLQSTELDARTAEYKQLHQTPQELMPVTIELAVTESQSQKKAQLALADMLGAKVERP